MEIKNQKIEDLELEFNRIRNLRIKNTSKMNEVLFQLRSLNLSISSKAKKGPISK